MSTSARQLGRVILRPVKKLQKPRPLKASNPARRSTPDAANVNIFDEVMLLTEAVTSNMSNGMFDINLQNNIVILSGMLKAYGECLEAIYKGDFFKQYFPFQAKFIHFEKVHQFILAKSPVKFYINLNIHANI